MSSSSSKRFQIISFWAGHVTGMREKRKVYRFWWESQTEKDYYEIIDVGRSII
jgi:hypothetical protein